MYGNIKYFLFLKLTIIFFLILTYLFFIFRKSNLYNYDLSLPILDNMNISYIKEFIDKYPKLSEIKLNYAGKCGEMFKYGRNTKRDLIMFAYKSYKSKRSLMTYNILASIKRNIPNAKVICFIPNNSKDDFVIKLLKYYNYLVIKENDFINITLVSSRFWYEYKYLNKNINFFDRVIHADSLDIYFFSDIFKTLKQNELVINKECGTDSWFGDKGNFILEHPNDIRWFNRSFGDNKEIVNLFKEIHPMVINAGLIMGDAKSYLKFLEILMKNINYTKALDYGYDQMLINVLYYSGKFNNINITFDLCTQRSCFFPKLIFNKTNGKLYYNRTGCSPILIHKFYPTKK